MLVLCIPARRKQRRSNALHAVISSTRSSHEITKYDNRGVANYLQAVWFGDEGMIRTCFVLKRTISPHNKYHGSNIGATFVGDLLERQPTEGYVIRVSRAALLGWLWREQRRSSKKVIRAIGNLKGRK